MDKVDVVCGQCGSKLELSLPHLTKEFSREVHRRTVCPSCQTEFPDALKTILRSLCVRPELLENWVVGTRINPDE